MYASFAPLLPIVFIVLMAGSIFWTSQRSAAIMDAWAAQNGVHFVNRQCAWFWRGPFWLGSSKHQTVYRITVCDSAGQTRTGWARCGSWWLGLLSDNIEVRWDE